MGGSGENSKIVFGERCMERANYLRVGPMLGVFIYPHDLFDTYSEVVETKSDRISTDGRIYHIKHTEEHEIPEGCAAIYVGDRVDNHIITKISPNPRIKFSEILHTKDLDKNGLEISYMVAHGYYKKV